MSKKHHFWRNERREIDSGAPQDIKTDSVEINPKILAEAKSKIVVDFADHVAFERIVNLFDAIIAKPKNRIEKFKKFVGLWKGDLFTLMRFLLPHLDKDRQAYGLKESLLAREYVDILNIAPTSEHGRALIQWKKPSNGRSAGNFAEIVELALQNRVAKESSISVGEVDRMLTQLHAQPDKARKSKVLRRLINCTTAHQQKWIVRLILRDLKLSMSEKTMLRIIHEDAEEYFNITSSLRQVCETLIDPRIRLPKTAGIQLFRAIKPMLASRVSKARVVETMKGKFAIETKYDGERIQVHMSKDKQNKPIVRLFTRNANEYTALYKTVLPMLRRHVKENIESCILDGELLIWDNIIGGFEPFGNMKTFANYDRTKQLNDENSEGDPMENGDMAGKQFCYVAFDILMLNGNNVTELTLSQRRELLEKCTRITPHVFQLSQLKVASSVEQIDNALNDAIDNREEGIMIKRLDSVYVPNERSFKWLKLKPEYEYSNDMDLVIIGGSYGEGARAGGCSRFLLGCAASDGAANNNTTAGDDGGDDDDDNDVRDKDNSLRAGGKPLHTVWYSCGKVGTGYTFQQLRELNERLKPHFRPFDKKSPPPMIKFGVEVPDLWIDPRHSVVLQVMASQIVVSEKFTANYTLRFPRTQRIRYDKSYKDAMDLATFLDLARSREGHLARPISDASDMAGSKRKRKAKQGGGAASSRALTLLPSAAAASLGGIAVVGRAFAGIELCVYTGDAQYSKQQLEQLIKRHGGTVVQEPSPDTYGVIAATDENVKVRNLKRHGEWNVLHYRWLLECASADRLVELEPKHMIYTNHQQFAIFRRDIDVYGDSYLRDTTVEDLKNVMGAMSVAKRRLQHAELVKFEDMVWGTVERPWHCLLRDHVLYFDGHDKVDGTGQRLQYSRMPLLENLAKFYGARVAQRLGQRVTHVIVDLDDLSRLPAIRKMNRHWVKKPPGLAKHVVTIDWLIESCNRHEDLDEAAYIVIGDGTRQRQKSF